MKLLRQTIACSLPAIALILSGCASAPRAEVVATASTDECVVLLHGLNLSWRAMRPMAEALQTAGFTTVNIDYPSQSGPIEDIAPLAVSMGLDECRSAGAERIHFVTHSLGGILLRYEQEHSPIPDLGRVVMLGPPNQGSEIIDKTRDWPGFVMVAGEAGSQLGTSAGSIPCSLGPVDFELGVIAGNRSTKIFGSALLPNPDDGRVSVASTRVDGMDDFLVVEHSHNYFMRRDIVFRNTESFLRAGRFLAADKAITSPNTTAISSKHRTIGMTDSRSVPGNFMQNP